MPLLNTLGQLAFAVIFVVGLFTIGLGAKAVSHLECKTTDASITCSTPEEKK